jgi:hypothetical protein
MIPDQGRKVQPFCRLNYRLVSNNLETAITLPVHVRAQKIIAALEMFETDLKTKVHSPCVTNSV